MKQTSQQLPLIYLARHGATAWSISGRHTGLTDLPLTEQGECNARLLGERLQGITVSQVYTSPLKRAERTCELAGFGPVATVDRDLVEWNYGAYEGKTTDEIEQQREGWDLFRDGCPDGESIQDVAVRANRVIKRLRTDNGNVLLFSSSHFLRVFTACWLGLDPSAGRYFVLDTASLSTLGYNHGDADPVIRLWNDCGQANR